MSWSIYTVVIAISGLWLVLVCAVVHGQNFRRCYETNNKYYCFYIDGSTSSWTDARQFCRNSNSTLPIITDANIQSVFEQFLYDSNSTRPAWIAAHTIDVNNSSNKWHWIDGSSTNLTPTPSNNDMFYPKWCSAVRNNTASSNRLLLEESAWVSSPPYYICQFNDITNCSTSGFMYNSKCYKYYNELVQGPWYSRWFTAVNKCLFKNGSLAVFDDNFLTTVSLPWLSSTSDGYYQAWIGLTKSWWIWSDTVGPVDVLYNNFNTSEGVVDTRPPYSPPQFPTSTEYCAAAGRTGYWLVENCVSAQRQVVCQSVSTVTTSTTETTTTTTTTTTTAASPTSTTTTTATYTTKSKTIASVGLGVGLGVGSFALTVIVVVVIIVVVRRTNNKQQQRSRSVKGEELVSREPRYNERERSKGHVNGNFNSNGEIVYGQIVPSTQPIVDQTVEDSKSTRQQVIYADLSTADNANSSPADVPVYANAQKFN